VQSASPEKEGKEPEFVLLLSLFSELNETMLKLQKNMNINF
jgi:hypothetical protein